MDHLIRKMSADDVAAVVRIESECFSRPWSESALAAELDKPRCDFFVLEIDGEIVAYIGTNICLDECFIANVAVRGPFRRRGFGRALVEYAAKNAESSSCSFITLEVRKSNTAAVRLYSSVGFAAEGERKRFYSEPDEDALIMTKRFSVQNNK